MISPLVGGPGRTGDGAHEPAEGYTDAGDAAPNPDNLYVSNHTTGKAIDVFIPWRKKDADASTNAWNAVGRPWKEIYQQFGLHRPMANEDWHVEMISKPINKGVEEA